MYSHTHTHTHSHTHTHTHTQVGTEEGGVHKCSVSYNEQYLETYAGNDLEQKVLYSATLYTI